MRNVIWKYAFDGVINNESIFFNIFTVECFLPVKFIYCSWVIDNQIKTLYRLSDDKNSDAVINEHVPPTPASFTMFCFDVKSVVASGKRVTKYVSWLVYKFV